MFLIPNHQKQNQKAQGKCDNLQQIVLKLQKKKYFTRDEFSELNLKAKNVEFLNRLIKKASLRNIVQNTPALKKFAVTLHYYSTTAYKYVRQAFNGSQPHPRVIGKWYENSFGDPGSNKQALEILEKKI